MTGDRPNYRAKNKNISEFSSLAEVVTKRITIITITESWFLAEDANWLEARNPFSYNPNKTRTVQL